MPMLKDLLKKKDKISAEAEEQPVQTLNVPEFKFVRTTTESEEFIEPPNYPDADENASPASPPSAEKKKQRDSKHGLHFRKSSNAEYTKDPTAEREKDKEQELAVRPKHERRLSSRLNLKRHSRSTSADSSVNLPQDLPDAPDAVGPAITKGTGSDGADEEKDVNEQREAQWEKRATMLAQNNPLRDFEADAGKPTAAQEKERARARSRSPSIADPRGDENIQEAIRLHEIGELGLSTAMFGRLGDPKGANNALAQVLYGLALRHGWGVPEEPEKAIHYLSLAASNSASIEKAALESGMKKGGAAKGELVLAIFELANCFRHGWGVKKDAVAARQYYETAANLGDTDAMEEAARCLEEGFGGPKDKFKAAQYLRLAEERGHKTVGNSWIWKEKYNPK